MKGSLPGKETSNGLPVYELRSWSAWAGTDLETSIGSAQVWNGSERTNYRYVRLSRMISCCGSTKSSLQRNRSASLNSYGKSSCTNYGWRRMAACGYSTTMCFCLEAM